MRRRASRIRAQAFRDVAFLTVSIAFALVLFAQVGFIVHLISFLDPVIGREQRGDRGRAADGDGGGRPRAVLDRDRPAQPAAGLGDLVRQPGRGARRSSSIRTTTSLLIAACALFGFSVGNLITLPALIVQREFDPRSFGVLISLITAINQVTYAFGPGVIGLLRDASGSYALPFYGCIGLELMAAVLIMVRGRKRPH